jgi:MFS family permease
MRIMVAKNSNDYYTEDFKFMVNIVIFNSMGFFFFNFLIPIVARINMNSSATEVGIIISLITIGLIISSSFVGFLVDRTDSKRNLVMIGSFGRATAYFVIYLAIVVNSLVILGIGTLILGFLAGFFWIPLDTLVAQKSSKDHRSHAYGKRDSANAIGQIIGGLAGFGIFFGLSAVNASPFFLYSAFLLYGIMNLIAGILFYTKVDETIKYYGDEVQNTANSSESPENNSSAITKIMLIGMIILSCVILLSSVNHTLARPYLNIYILENITDEMGFVILAYFPTALFATFLAPRLGKLADKIPPAIGIPILASSGALMTWLLISTTNIWIFTGLLLIDLTIGMSAGLIFINIMSRINIKHRGKIMSLSSFFTNLGSSIGPILGGFVYDSLGSAAPFIISIFVELLIIPLYLIIIKILIPYAEETYS